MINAITLINNNDLYMIKQRKSKHFILYVSTNTERKEKIETFHLYRKVDVSTNTLEYLYVVFCQYLITGLFPQVHMLVSVVR